MKNEALFHRTVKILVDAYLNDTLLHGNCCACAVGNIVAANQGFTVEIQPCGKDAIWHKDDFVYQPNWSVVFLTRAGRQTIRPSLFEEYNSDIISTGYHFNDLAKIEFAFETAPMGETDDEWMYNGLMAVVNVLCDIHEMNETTKQEAKSLFVR